jgi:pre-60S factor REI1
MWTCLSCSIGFPSPDAQREHYRSDLHRYNMKRRVAGLPAVRQDVFASKVSEMQGAAEGGKKEESDRCEACA